ncbi:MAG TPA: hypothetical protein GX390_02500 [Acholeplasmataceae bacterium]|jgi:predicted branched-subunit amino acid permease|nr:hypothetical protein [Acholeplasmataceae bacterium]
MSNRTRNITLAAVLAALSIVLKVLSLQFESFRILNFSPITLLMAGYFLGLKQGILIAFLTDTVYALFLPANQTALSQAEGFLEIAVVIATNFWNLFTVSTILWGAGGFFIKKIGFKHQLFAIMIVAAVIALTETSINTIQMIIWKMPTAIPGLPLRIFNQLYRIPLIIIATNEIMGRLENKELKEFLSL